MARTMRGAFLVVVVASHASAEQFAAFDSASASSVYLGSGDFGPAAAISGGSTYWSSSGNHVDGKPVSWTGALNVRRKAIGIKVNWAYGPGEVKVLTSADGGNFEEVVPWRRSTKGEAAYIETFMFAEPRNVMAVSILMRDPQRWRFMGITNVALLVEPGPFMLVSGAPAPDGELCVVGRNGILEVQPCVAAIVAGDGAEIFSFGVDGELVSAPSKACASLSNGVVALAPCGPDTSAFELQASGQIKASRDGDVCLALSGSAPNYIVTALGCADAAQRVDALDKFSMVAVGEYDPHVAGSASSTAGLVVAASSRLGALVAELRKVGASCGLASAHEAARVANAHEDGAVARAQSKAPNALVGAKLSVERQAAVDAIAAAKQALAMANPK